MTNTQIGDTCCTRFPLSLFILLLAVFGSVNAQGITEPFSVEASKAAASLPGLILDSSEPFTDIKSANLDGLMQRIGDARLVLLGEASHGTLEFYEMRTRITRKLIEEKGFNIIAIEGDWPDASRIDFFIRDIWLRSRDMPAYREKPFAVFPIWMWRNHSVFELTDWLREYNRSVRSTDKAVAFYGLDVYNLFGSIQVVLDYLFDIDPDLAEFAYQQYSCLFPWQYYPPYYGLAIKAGKARSCTANVVNVYEALRNRAEDFRPLDEYRYFDVMQNARLIKNGEQVFRTMKVDNKKSWDLRDTNMFESLQAILNYHGESSKIVIWAHNDHIGDRRATDPQARGKISLGQLVREAYGDSSYLIGFSTHHGTVAASPRWNRPVKLQKVPPAHEDSYEHLFHQVNADNFMLPLRHPKNDTLREKLLPKRLVRTIGVAYEPKNELNKHYYAASLPEQFDEYIFFDETRSVKPAYQP